MIMYLRFFFKFLIYRLQIKTLLSEIRTHLSFKITKLKILVDK
jgi:hypothetical protein